MDDLDLDKALLVLAVAIIGLTVVILAAGMLGGAVYTVMTL